MTASADRYDAVNAIDGHHRPYLVAPPARRWYSQDAAAATAAYDVLVNSRAPVFPGAPPETLAYLKTHYDASLAVIPTGRPRRAGSRPATPPRRP